MHWSYIEPEGSNLAQGDILLPTNDIRNILQYVHKWFVDPKYLGFMVLSQTCDMVRRNGGLCKTPYVNIGVIRPLRQVWLSLVETTCEHVAGRYFLASSQGKAKSLIERIINQNEEKLGLFYVHQDVGLGIGEPSVAMLRVSIALQSSIHYDALLDARRGSLEPNFAARLGWLCGNLYSRVGVPDWSEDAQRRKAASQIVDSFFDPDDECAPVFKDSRRLAKDFRDGTLDLGDKSATEVERLLERYTGPSFKRQAIDAVKRILESQDVAPNVIQRIVQSIENDPGFTNAVRTGSL